MAQINGPKLTVLLDLEPIRPKEGEAEAALRLLRRMRRAYGPRFFGAVTIDGWYVQGPFLKALDKLGWPRVVVLKQERMEVFQEARALSAGRAPTPEFCDQRRQRQIKLWEVRDLNFSKAYGYGRKVTVVHSQEQWTETKVIGGQKIIRPQTKDWWWMASGTLQGYPSLVIYEVGHWRWGTEDKAFNELTQFYALEHCYNHEPVAMVAQMLILMLGFVLFNAYALLHSQRVRWGQVCLKELAQDLNLALEEPLRWGAGWIAAERSWGAVLSGCCSLKIGRCRQGVPGPEKRCRLVKAFASPPSIRTGGPTEKNSASGQERRKLTHLAELLGAQRLT